MEQTVLSVPRVAGMELDPPHTSFLLIFIKIRKVSPEKFQSRNTDTWLYSGIELALLNQAPTLNHVATVPSRPQKDMFNCRICLPGSHPHCIFQQLFSELIT